MSRRAWVAFVVVQLVGVVCVWEGPRILTAPGPVLFVTGMVLLAALTAHAAKRRRLIYQIDI